MTAGFEWRNYGTEIARGTLHISPWPGSAGERVPHLAPRQDRKIAPNRPPYSGQIPAIPISPRRGTRAKPHTPKPSSSSSAITRATPGRCRKLCINSSAHRAVLPSQTFDPPKQKPNDATSGIGGPNCDRSCYLANRLPASHRRPSAIVPH
jgi:hypothetical protein